MSDLPMDDSQKLYVAAQHYAAFCKTLGINLDLEDTKDTPKRVAKLFLKEFTAGMREKPFTFTTFPSKNHDLVSVCGTLFNSVCRHHHLPMTGYAHFAYLPNQKIAGLSKIPRLIKWVGAQPHVQEEMTHELLDKFVKELDPKYAAVTIIAKHSCMACRGVHDNDSRTITTAVYSDHGGIDNYRSTHEEFLRSINLWYQDRDA